jgi:hypothetical protein
MLRQLSSGERKLRGLLLALVSLVLLLLFFIDPESTPRLPFATSCGAMTGLPCIFCGTTRAIHHLLDGEFGRALYYNWLAFPVVTAAFGLIAILGCELLFGLNFLARLPRPRVTPRKVGAFAAGLFCLWILQVYLAVSQHKTELLNPRGPLYSFVVSKER